MTENNILFERYVGIK